MGETNKPQQLPPALMAAPVALVSVDSNDTILLANDAASAMGLTTGLKMADVVPDIDEPFAGLVRVQPASTIYRIRTPDREKRCRATWVEEGEHLMIWLFDMTEQLAVAGRFQQEGHPNIKKLRQLNQLAVTASGYAELLDVVMEDEHLAADKTSTLKQYQTEVSRNLAAMLDVLRGDPTSNDKRGMILVADEHQDLANLISELLRTEGYRAESFSDANSVLKYLQVNADRVTGAIIDENLVTDGGPLIMAVKPFKPDLEVIALSNNENAQAQGKIAKPVDFQALLQSVQRYPN